MLDFQKEIVEFAGVADTLHLIDNVGGVQVWSHFQCCFNCYYLATNMGKKLPLNLHNRMMLSEPNMATKRYIDYYVRFST